MNRWKMGEKKNAKMRKQTEKAQHPTTKISRITKVRAWKRRGRQRNKIRKIPN